MRDAVKRQTPAGREADGFMKRGLLVPDVLIARLMAELVAEVNESCTLLLDGFPRTVEQARMLDEMAAGGGAQFQAVVLLEVGDEVLVERIAGRRHCPTCDRGYHVTKIPPKLAGVCDGCGTTLAVRKDDNPETVKNRLDVYREQTMPLIDFYRDRGLLRRVDGLGPIDGIVERVRQAIA